MHYAWLSQVVRTFRSAVTAGLKACTTLKRYTWALNLHPLCRPYGRADKGDTVPDEPRREDPETPAEPAQVDDTATRAKARDESTEDVEAEAIDDDRFQATDN